MPLLDLLFATAYDLMLAPAERETLAAHRRELLAHAVGRVLELGAGTGVNLPFYGSSVHELVAVEPSGPMRARLRRNAARCEVPVSIVAARSEHLPFEDAWFDSAVSTLVLCSVSDLARSLSELWRVLRPGGRLLFLEHIRSDDPALARWQDRLRGAWSMVGLGCQCNRRTVRSIEEAGFSLSGLSPDALRPAPAIVRPLVIGLAVRRPSS